MDFTLFNNVDKRVVDDLKVQIQRGSKLQIAAASFSIYAFEALREELQNIDSLQFLFTSPTFTTDKTAKENMELFGPLYDEFDEKEFYKAMQKMKLSVGKTVGRMSRGELFKFQTAFAMAHKPALYLIDEATAGMDPVFRIDYFKILQEIIAAEDAAILMTSHIQDEIQRKMDFVGIMEDGKLVDFGETLDIFP